jgi:hypothetical protein
MLEQWSNIGRHHGKISRSGKAERPILRNGNGDKA